MTTIRSELIRVFGGLPQVARLLGLGYSTPYRWFMGERERVPAYHLRTLAREARRLGNPLRIQMPDEPGDAGRPDAA